jgi:hypothetical protein
MSLTPLDLGAGRFLEFRFTVVYKKVFEVEDLKRSSQALLGECPILRSRLSFFVCPFHSTRDKNINLDRDPSYKYPHAHGRLTSSNILALVSISRRYLKSSIRGMWTVE